MNSWPPRHIRCTLAPPGHYAHRRGLTEDEILLMLGLPPALVSIPCGPPGTGPSIWDPSEIEKANFVLTLEGTSQKNSKKVKKPVKLPPTRYELLRRARG